MSVSADADDVEADADAGGDALLSRLRTIEQRPLDERASAYSAVHAELAATLEGGDPRSSR